MEVEKFMKTRKILIKPDFLYSGAYRKEGLILGLIVYLKIIYSLIIFIHFTQQVCNLFWNMVEPADPFSKNYSKYNCFYEKYSEDKISTDSSDNDILIIHRFTEPRVEYGQLPDGLNYLHILCPGKDIHLEYEMNSMNSSSYYNSMVNISWN